MKKIINNTLKNIQRARDLALDLIFPVECLGCSTEGSWLCRSCFRKLEFKPFQYCPACKRENRFGKFCENCRTNYAIDGIWIAGDYENRLIASLIRHLKYRFIRDISESLGGYLALFLRDFSSRHCLAGTDLSRRDDGRKFDGLTRSPRIFREFDRSLILPVPLSRKRRNWRGFNQAEGIAGVVADSFGLDFDTENLTRVKHKKPQAKLGEADRKTNIIDCYAWRGSNLKGRHAIIVDDVTTTGSTLNECARVLKAAGAGEVWGLVVAKG